MFHALEHIPEVFQSMEHMVEHFPVEEIVEHRRERVLPGHGTDHGTHGGTNTREYCSTVEYFPEECSKGMEHR